MSYVDMLSEKKIQTLRLVELTKKIDDNDSNLSFRIGSLCVGHYKLATKGAEFMEILSHGQMVPIVAFDNWLMSMFDNVECIKKSVYTDLKPESSIYRATYKGKVFVFGVNFRYIEYKKLADKSAYELDLVRFNDVGDIVDDENISPVLPCVSYVKFVMGTEGFDLKGKEFKLFMLKESVEMLEAELGRNQTYLYTLEETKKDGIFYRKRTDDKIAKYMLSSEVGNMEIKYSHKDKVQVVPRKKIKTISNALTSARSNPNVLITGDMGSGKSVLMCKIGFLCGKHDNVAVVMVAGQDLINMLFGEGATRLKELADKHEKTFVLVDEVGEVLTDPKFKSSRGKLLSWLEGTQSALNNIQFVLTTSRTIEEIEKVVKDLLRPGRVDIQVRLGSLSKEQGIAKSEIIKKSLDTASETYDDDGLLTTIGTETKHSKKNRISLAETFAKIQPITISASEELTEMAKALVESEVNEVIAPSKPSRQVELKTDPKPNKLDARVGKPPVRGGKPVVKTIKPKTKKVQNNPNRNTRKDTNTPSRESSKNRGRRRVNLS